jgi:hypothetical protein
MKFLTIFSPSLTAAGKSAEARHIPLINIKLGTITPELSVDFNFLGFDIN